MSAWEHAICPACWEAFFPHHGAPMRVIQPSAEICCFCGLRTTAGIYVRHNPKNVRCKGKHNE